VAPENWKQPTR